MDPEKDIDLMASTKIKKNYMKHTIMSFQAASASKAHLHKRSKKVQNDTRDHLGM